MKIIQDGYELFTDINTIPAQLSGNIRIEFEKSAEFADYVAIPFVGYGNQQNLKTLELSLFDSVFELPPEVFDRDGYITIAFALFKDNTRVNTKPISFRVAKSVGSNSVLPENRELWEKTVISVVDQYIDINVVPIINEFEDTMRKLIETATQLQKDVDTKLKIFDTHLLDKENPHSVTLNQVDKEHETIRYKDDIVIGYEGKNTETIHALTVSGIKLRTTTQQLWSENNPILLDGEIGIAQDIKRLKIGNGLLTWNELSWFGGGTEMYDNKSLFPSVGIVNTIYIDLSDRKTYIWLSDINDYKDLTSSGGLVFEETLPSYTNHHNPLEQSTVISRFLKTPRTKEVFYPISNSQSIIHKDTNVYDYLEKSVQSSDKSVKDIVTVTRQELDQLKTNGALVAGTLYQTAEPAEELNINKDAFMTLTQTSIYTLTSTKTEHPFVAITNHQGDCFYNKDNRVVVKKGVKKVRITAYAYFQNVSSGNKYLNTYVTGNRVDMNYNYINTQGTIATGSVIVDVNENDEIYHGVAGVIGDVIYTSFITVEAISKDYTLGDIRGLIKEITELKEYIANNEIESGEGYIKYPDGNLICYGKFETTITINEVWGTLLSVTKGLDIAFKKAFISTPAIIVQPTDPIYALINSGVVCTNTKITKVILARATGIENLTTTFSYQAIGRWK